MSRTKFETSEAGLDDLSVSVSASSTSLGPSTAFCNSSRRSDTKITRVVRYKNVFKHSAWVLGTASLCQDSIYNSLHSFYLYQCQSTLEQLRGGQRRLRILTHSNCQQTPPNHFQEKTLHNTSEMRDKEWSTWRILLAGCCLQLWIVISHGCLRYFPIFCSALLHCRRPEKSLTQNYDLLSETMLLVQNLTWL